ncbi:LOW QUALITY PROTEIN: hypothetical protein OSB04_019755 [Centaurea solstitialis]|uniref:Reverse transcriptase zinc-binding domain-containing protein n=1 Tax=Centaurea solstitialis TaxID=347529 RepID=A0AA38T9E5_9ASTR|nr:LOW QUALITY PROTEIN: hypothetical protein OSB04_019755 [Centaurea solstitialis]
MTELVDYHTLWKNYTTFSQRVFELNQENLKLSSDKSLLEMKIVDLQKLIQTEKGQESENSKLSNQITELQQSLSISNAEKADLLIKVTDLEESLSNERSLITSLKIDLQNEHDEMLKHSFGNAQNLKLVTSLRKENECLQKKVHELDEDKKIVESKLISSHSRVIELSNQVNDFEKIVIIERSNFEKERLAFEAKIGELSLKISVFDEQKENKIFKEFSESTCYVNCCYDDDDSNSYDGMNVFDSLESCTDSCTNKNNVVDGELVKFEKMLQDERKVFEEERKVFEKERKSFELKSDKLSKKISDLERQIVNERKDFEKKKNVFESKKKGLKKKNVRVEKDRCVEFEFEEESKGFEKERKSFEEKSVLFRKKIANLEVQLSDERSAFKRKEQLLKNEIKGFEQLVVELKKPAFEKNDFEEENRVFEMEIRKLTRSLSELSSDILKEQIMSSNLKKKLDETVEEKNLISAMVKDLEDIVFKVNLNEPKSPDVIVQSLYVDYADSVCSFKTAPSSLHVDVSSTKSFTPTNQIRTSNLFYDYRIDGSGKNHSKKDYLKRKYVVLTVEQIILFEKNRRKVGMDFPTSNLNLQRFGLLYGIDGISLEEKGEFWSNKVEMNLNLEQQNGAPTKEFKMMRGIRQGDPLAPFLFLIVAEGLNVLMLEAREKGLFVGSKVGKDLVEVSHLQYADDVVFFRRVVVWQCKKFNEDSQMLQGDFGAERVNPREVQDWANDCRCGWSSLPISFLGLPLGQNMNRIDNWKVVIEKMRNKLASWKAKSMSFGGRLTLVKSVLGSLVLYYLSLFRAPRGVLIELERVRSRFFWGGGVVGRESGKGVVWVNWARVLRILDKGGFDVGSLEVSNRGLLGKWWWKFVSEKEGLWVKVIRSIYGSSGGFVVLGRLEEVLGFGGGGIVKVYQELETLGVNLGDSVGLEVGSGLTTSFWYDRWLGGVPLAVRFKRIWRLEVDKEARVADRWTREGDGWSGRWRWRREPRGREAGELNDLLTLLQVWRPNASVCDKVRWNLAADGTFSVKSLKDLIKEKLEQSVDSTVKTIWSKLVPKKIAIHAWRVRNGRIPTRDVLDKMGIDLHSTLCPLCSEVVETWITHYSVVRR